MLISASVTGFKESFVVMVKRICVATFSTLKFVLEPRFSFVASAMVSHSFVSAFKNSIL